MKNIKKIIYYISATILGILLSLLAHAATEYVYLSQAMARDFTVKWVSFGSGVGCALPLWIQISLLLTGIIGGFLLGRRWWRIIYIEKRYSGIIDSLKN